jgi:hypothetical protein
MIKVDYKPTNILQLGGTTLNGGILNKGSA